MIRKFLRKVPLLYSMVRKIHIVLNNIVRFPQRYKMNKKVKKRISTLQNSDANRIFYLCVPIHNNLGDYAQYICINNWIKDTYSDYEKIEIPTDPLCYDYLGVINEMKSKLKKGDIFIFQSGYTSSDLHTDEVVHRKIAKYFKSNQIIFFPQTVKYSSDKEIKKTAEIYNSHGEILFLTRDKQSYEEAKKYFTKIKVELYPDIVTSLIGTFHKEKTAKREGVVFCIRSDSEKFYTDASIKKEFKEVYFEKSTWLDTTLKRNQKCNESLIEEYIRIFSEHELVITDRFHGTIISLISETPVIVLKTTDHKVSEGANWFVDVFPNYIYNASDLQNTAKKAKEMLEKHNRCPINSYFKEKYYDVLKDTINKL